MHHQFAVFGVLQKIVECRPHALPVGLDGLRIARDALGRFLPQVERGRQQLRPALVEQGDDHRGDFAAHLGLLQVGVGPLRQRRGAALDELTFGDVGQHDVGRQQLRLHAFAQAAGNLRLVLRHQPAPAQHRALLGLKQHLDRQKVGEIPHATGNGDHETRAKPWVAAIRPVVQPAQYHRHQQQRSAKPAVPIHQVNVHAPSSRVSRSRRV